ncbi:MAG: 50S ribosomal protein L32 [Bacilli bacterium]|nr:50S ribosomal protein L32 [Bacilli bacterium]
MAVPQRRISKTRKRLRRTHFKLTVTGLVTCPNCGALIKSHQVCPKCGYYNGKVVMAKGKLVKAEAKKTEAPAKKTVKKTTKKAVAKEAE